MPLANNKARYPKLLEYIYNIYSILVIQVKYEHVFLLAI